MDISEVGGDSAQQAVHIIQVDGLFSAGHVDSFSNGFSDYPVVGSLIRRRIALEETVDLQVIENRK